MATSPSVTVGGTFTITDPGQGAQIMNPPGGRVNVTINNQIAGVTSFNVTIAQVDGSQPNTVVLTSIDGVHFNGSALATPLPIGMPAANNKLVSAVGTIGSGSTATTTGTQSNTFKAWTTA